MSFQEKNIAFIEEKIAGVQFPTQPENLYDPLRYFLTLGGKRIRPLLTLLAGEICGVSKENSIHAGLAIEWFHNFSLIHDDIMDHAPLRRKLPTIHEKWNSNIAILSGDVLLMHAFEQINVYPPETYKKLSSYLVKTSIEVCIGQQMDMDFEREDHIDEAAYIEMIRLKTSVLLGCACAFGGILAEKEQETVDLLYVFGEQLGITFQIQDDLLDAFGDPEKFGKQIGGDILCDKKTLLVTAFEALSNESQKESYKNLKQEVNPAIKIEKIKSLFTSCGVIEYCQAAQKKYHSQAEQTLATLSKALDTTELQSLLDYLFSRET